MLSVGNPAGRGMLLTMRRIDWIRASLVEHVRSPVLQRDIGNRRSALTIVQHEQGMLLETMSTPENYSGLAQPEQLHSTRPHHRQTRYGKSTLLLMYPPVDSKMAAALLSIAPMAIWCSGCLVCIPQSGLMMWSWLDPADEYYSVGFNILSAFPASKRICWPASDLVSMFQRLSTSWGDRMDSVFRNAVLAFLESDRPGTLHDLRRFLLEPSFQADFLTSVRDANVPYIGRKFSLGLVR